MAAGAAAVMLGMGISSAIASMTAGVIQAQMYRRQAEFNARTYEINRKIADLNAEDALRRGERLVEQHRKGVKQIIGQQRVSFAAQNVELSDGSAIEVMESSARIGEMEALTISNNAWKESFGYRIAALNSLTQAGAARIQGETQAAGAIITGGLQAFNQAGTGYYRYKTA